MSRSDWSCPNCDSSDVYLVDAENDEFVCKECGTQTDEVGGRTATVNRDSDGNALGCTIYLNGAELRDLGVDLENTNQIHYRVADGRLIVTDGGEER